MKMSNGSWSNAGATCLVSVLACLCAAPIEAAEGISESALIQIRALQEEKAARSAALNKLDSQLIYGLRQSRNQLSGFGITHLRPNLNSQADGRVLLDLTATVTPELLSQIALLGGQVVDSVPQFNSVRVRLPLLQVETLATHSAVRFIQPAVGCATHTGSLNSEGDTTHNAGLGRNVFRIDGTGTSIGVLSDSVDFMANSQATGDLPPDVTVLPGQSGVPGSGEGTAMMEIVHDLSPGSKIFFASAFGGQARFAQNILDLRAAGCDVIVDDVFYFTESPFQDGIIAQAVNTVTEGGALYFSSAGNEGNQNDGTSGVWEGDFLDGGPVGTPVSGKGGNLHSFGAATFNTAIQGGFAAVLFWSDPLGASTNDYDLYVLDDTGNNVVSASTTVQNGTQDPVELTFPPAPGERVVIVKATGDSRFLHLTTLRGRLTISTAGVTKGHSAATNAFSVAAVDVDTAFPNPFTGGPANPVEFFSSDGPRRVFYQADGSAITPGNYLATGGAVRQKPDIAAADGVATTVPGFNPFFGTSAAAPHAAAIAALLKSYNPELTPAQIRQVLTSTALDIEANGIDRDSGAGLVMALQALIAAPVVSPAPNLVYVTNAVFGGNGNSFIDFNECVGMNIILTNIGRAGATGVRATLSSTTPGVIIARPEVDYPDIPVNAPGTNLIPFNVSTIPTFNCGMMIDFRLVVKTDQITITNRFGVPSGALGLPVKFDNNTPVAIPDADLRGTNSAVVVTNVMFAVTKATVSLFITHTFDGDLTLQLISPDGTTNTLSANNGFFGNNYGVSCGAEGQRTTFDDDATTPITGGAPPFLGTFKPEQALSVFNGKSGTNVNGTWLLRVVDDALIDVGTINCWSLTLVPASCFDGGGECPGADMAIGMTAAPEPSLVGGNLTYTINVTNRGPSTAKNVIVSQSLPGTVIFSSAVSSQGNCSQSGGVVTCNLGDMGALTTATITVVVVPAATGIISSSAAATSNQPDFDSSNNNATVVSHVSPPTADLVLGMAAAPNPVTVGGTLTYTLSLTNKGPSTATGVTVTNVYPSTVAVTSTIVSQGTVSTSSNRVICSFGTLVNGGQASATIQVTPTQEGPLTAVATAVANQLDPVFANNQATNTTPVGAAADLVLTLIDSPDPVVLGSNLTYVLNVTNRGPSAANNVVLNSTLPASAVIISTNTTQGVINVQSNTVTCVMGSLQSGSSAVVTVVVSPTNLGTINAAANISGGQVDPVPGNNNAAASTLVANPFVSIVTAGATLTEESVAPPNGALDPGETVVISLRLRNAGNVLNTNLTATLLATNGVAPIAPNSPQNYGVLAPSGFPVARSFGFTASGTNGGTVTVWLQLQDGPNNLGLLAFNFSLPSVYSFANTNAITIRDNTNALPYPSTISVAGLTGVVGKVTATLVNLNHTFPQDVDALVVGAGGQNTLLMSGAGAPNLMNATVTFDDTASGPVPSGSPILSTSYQPANYSAAHNLPGPAPAAPYPAAMSVFNAANPNGTWSLFVADQATGDVGSVAGGWNLTFSLISPINQLADIVMTGTATPNPVLAGGNLTYTFSITNGGPSAATFLAFTNVLPAGVSFVSASSSQGAVALNGSTIIGNLGGLNAGATAAVSVVVSPTAAVAGLLTNKASVFASETDLNPGNNAPTVVSTVNLPLADVGLSLTQAPNPAVIGLFLTNIIAVTNYGPGLALETALTNPILPGFNFISASSTLGVATNQGGQVICQFGNLAPNAGAVVRVAVSSPNIGTFTNLAYVGTRSSDTNPANNTVASVFSVVGLAPNIVASGSLLTSETGPINGAIDDGETVTVLLGLRNEGSADATNVTATLQNSGGVTPTGPAQKSYGRLNQGGSAATNSFSFLASGTNGGVVVATLLLTDGSSPLGAVAFAFNLPGTTSFSNSTAIIIPDHGAGSPYPSTITVSGLTGLVNKVTLTIQGLTHSFPRDINALVVSPAGDKTLLMSHAGGPHSISNLTLTFNDAAAASLPNGSPISGGAYKPSAYGGISFPAPAPAAPYGPTMSALNGQDPNGIWSLYLFDDSNGDGGVISAGWVLDITTATTLNALADVSVEITSSAPSVYVGAPVTNSISVTNFGPSSATAVTVTHPLPLGALFVTAAASQGTVSGPADDLITAHLGTLEPGAGALVRIVEVPSLGGTMFNLASVGAYETDINPDNNTDQFNVSVLSPLGARLSAEWLTNQVQITVAGEANLTYILQGSTDLVNWTALSTNTAVGGTFKYIDPNSQSLQRRYYRAVRGP